MNKRFGLSAIAAILFSASTATAQTAPPVYVPVQVIGATGTFSIPYAVATDPAGNIIVADTYHQLVQVFDPTGLTLIATYGVKNIDDTTVAGDYAGLPGSACANYGSWDSSTGLPRLVATPRNDCFNFPTGVATDSGGRIYVTDAGNRRVMIFDTVANRVRGKLKFLTAFGTMGGLLPLKAGGVSATIQPAADGDFSAPIDVVIDRSAARVKDRIYVLDQFNNRIQAFDFNPTTLAVTFVTKFPTPPPGQDSTLGTLWTQFSYPQGFGIDQATGNIAVADTYNQRLQVFHYPFTGPNGGLIPALQLGATQTILDPVTGLQTQFPVAGGGYGWDGLGTFSSPTDATFDSLGRAWVVDHDFDRIQVINPNGTNAFVVTGTGQPDTAGLTFPTGMELDEARQRVIITGGDDTVQIWKPAAIGVAVSALPTTPTAGSTVTLTVTVTNTGQVPLTQIQPSVSSTSPSTAYLDPANLPAPTTTVLNPGASVPIGVPVTFNSTGAVTLSFAATAVHALSAMPVTAWPVAASRTVGPAAGAAVAVLSVAAAPSPVMIGGAITVSVSVKNTGTVDLNNVTATIAAAGMVVASPGTVPIGTLLVGASQTVTLPPYTAGAAPGAATFTASATAIAAGTLATVAPTAPQTASVAVRSDVLAPVTSISVTPGPNANGYWNHGADATLRAVDTGGSGIARICYQYQVLASNTGGCAVPSVATSNFDLPLGIIADGNLQRIVDGNLQQIVTITYHAEDNAGNIETARTYSILADPLPPTTQFATPTPAPRAAPAPDGTHWNNSPFVTIPFSTVDGLSGVASVTVGGVPVNLSRQQLTIGIEGKDMRGAVIATDAAGNSGTYSSPAVSIDRQPPIVTATLTSLAPRDTQGAYQGPVTVTFTAVDPAPDALLQTGVTVGAHAGSGVDVATLPAPVTISALGSTTVTRTICDYAGNCASPSATFTITTPTSGSGSLTTLAASRSSSVFGQPVTFTATVTATAAAAGTVTFKDGSTTLGTAAVNAAGQATLTTSALALGSHTIVATFSGNAGVLGSVSAPLTQWVFAYATGGGTFVIGDLNAHLGQSVTFWGAHWDKINSVSGGSGSASFKGFASAPAVPTVGATFTAAPGNSAPPPSGVPAYMGIIVTSKVTKSGSTICGTIVGMVIVKVDPGYAGNPGHAGTGTIVAIVQ